MPNMDFHNPSLPFEPEGFILAYHWRFNYLPAAEVARAAKMQRVTVGMRAHGPISIVILTFFSAAGGALMVTLLDGALSSPVAFTAVA